MRAHCCSKSRVPRCRRETATFFEIFGLCTAHQLKSTKPRAFNIGCTAAAAADAAIMDASPLLCNKMRCIYGREERAVSSGALRPKRGQQRIANQMHYCCCSSSLLHHLPFFGILCTIMSSSDKVLKRNNGARLRSKIKELAVTAFAFASASASIAVSVFAVHNQ